MSSKSFLKDMFGVHKVQLDNTGLGLYGYLKVLYDQNSDSIFATAGPNENNKTIVGYVTQGTIMRPEINSILSRRGTDIDHEFSQRVGIVGVRLNDDTPAGVMQAFELPADERTQGKRRELERKEAIMKAEREAAKKAVKRLRRART